MTDYLYERGKRRRKMHLAGYDRLGRCVGALCGIRLNLNTSINVSLGRKICKRCRKIEDQLA